MRKISKLAIEAFMGGCDFKQSNTTVLVFGNGNVQMFLHGHLIAEKHATAAGFIFRITNAGYFTNVTKERLNAIPGVSIHQTKFQWYLNGKEWDGSWITID